VVDGRPLHRAILARWVIIRPSWLERYIIPRALTAGGGPSKVITLTAYAFSGGCRVLL